MRFTLPLAALALVAFQAQAQTPSTTPSTTPAPAASQPSTVAPTMPAPTGAAPSSSSSPATHHAHAKRMTLQERFDQANTSHDGHLTLDQAKAGLPGVARHFGAIDKDKKGYVTVEEIHAYNTQHRAHRTATHHAAASSS
jgi:hypothetical protein